MVNWRTSTYTHTYECVEAGSELGSAGVRDTKDREGIRLEFSPAAWKIFTSRLK